MNYNKILSFLALSLIGISVAQAQVADSVDVLDYDVAVDLRN